MADKEQVGPMRYWMVFWAQGAWREALGTRPYSSLAELASQDSRFGWRTMHTDLLTGEVLYSALTLRDHCYVATHEWPKRDEALRQLKQTQPQQTQEQSCDQKT